MIGNLLELRKLLKNRYLSPSELRALQETKLQSIIQHAYDKVPYYRSLFRSAGLSPEDVRTIEDLRQLPITTKTDLRAAGTKKSIAKGVDLSSCLKSRGSGSTGQPFDVYHDLQEVRIRRLAGFRALLVAGFRPRDRLCGFHRVPFKPTLVQHLGFFRTENISPILPVGEQIQHLQRIQPTVLRAQPNQLRAILHEIDYQLDTIGPPRVLITNGEVFDEGLRREILAQTNVEIFDFYVSTEFSNIATECSAHEGLHVTADHLVLECLRDNGDPAAPREPGKVVVTSLYARTMPLIRYQLDDVCTWAGRECSCGSSFPLIDPPLGRMKESIVLPSGRIVGMRGLTNILVQLEGIDQFRLVQEKLGHLVLELAFWQEPGDGAISQTKTQLLDHLGEPIRLDIKIVDHFQNKPGKFKRFISRLPENEQRLQSG